MPRRKNVANDPTKSQKAPTRRSARHAATQEQVVPEIYRDMLVEAYHNNPDDFAPSSRPTKRRKVDGAPSIDEQDHITDQVETVEASLSSPPPPLQKSPASELVSAPPQQVAFNNDISESEEDSDIEFEDVEIVGKTGTEAEESTDDQFESKTLQIDLSIGPVASRKPIQRRKPVSKAERDFRIHVHKWHFLTLLAHVATRNKWCDDERVQKTLKPLVSRKTISNLHLPETRLQAERKFAFERAIEEVCKIWSATWKVTCKGMRRAIWRENLDMEEEIEAAEDPVDFEDFRDAARSCSGSRDLGAQLFCALLRSLAVEARLVCSFQVLPFSRAAKGETPQKAAPPAYIQAGDQDYGTSRASSGSNRKKKQKKIVDSPFPIWWVEVFNATITQWIPLDPVVRNTINKPRTGFEPPASDSLNSMSYVIAFEEDGTAKDITKRYASMYNAKTRKSRVESTKDGVGWLEKVMRVFSKGLPETRDIIEDAELVRRVQLEGMPKNVQDFKDHPVYVLERHLRSNEVIHPKRESGKFTVGTGKNQKVESVYRREDVYACRSADGWYRKGRDVKVGEQPLKRVVPKHKRSGSMQAEDEEDDEAEGEGVALYAEFQTDVYVPPPVVDAQVPRNGYGNLDVYVNSMIPAGAVHVKHPLAMQAAKTLGIDAAEAVTGFKFKGRQGTAIIDGVVIDARYTAATLTTISILEDQLEEEVNAQRSSIMYGVWKKMYAVLRVRQKVQEEYGDDSVSGFKADNRHGEGDDNGDDDDDGDGTYEDEADAGGFVAEVVGEATKSSKAEEVANLSLLRERAPVVLPPLVVRQSAVVVRSPHKLEIAATSKEVSDDDDDLFGSDPEVSGGFEAKGYLEVDEPGGFVIDDYPKDDSQSGGFVRNGEDEGGGFVLEGQNQAGGYVPEGSGSGGFISEDGPVDAQRMNQNPLEQDLAHDDLQRLSTSRRAPAGNVDEGLGGFIVEQQREDQLRDADESNSLRPEPVSKDTRKLLPSHGTSAEEQPLAASQRSNDNSLPSTQTSNGTRRTRKNKDKQKETAEDLMSEASLPSHDPEEDDVEPEWLADAFDDDM